MLPIPKPFNQNTFHIWQDNARKSVVDILGIPKEKVSLNQDNRGEILLNDIVIEKWVITSENKSKLPALVYRPKNAQKMILPAVILAFGHTGSKSHPIYNYLGQLFAKLNMICLAIDPIGEEERHPKLLMESKSHDDPETDKICWGLGRPILGKMVFDLMRGIDFLVERIDVNVSKIAVIGHSFGGVQASFLASIDQRISFTLISGWGFSTLLEQSSMACTRIPCNKLRGYIDWAEFLILIASNSPIFIANGNSDSVVDIGGVGQVWLDTASVITDARKILNLAKNPNDIILWYERDAGHRSLSAHPIPLAWLVNNLEPDGWSREKILESSTLKFSNWAEQNGIGILPFYAQPNNEGNATFVDLGIRYIKPQNLRVLHSGEIGADDYTINGWIKNIKRNMLN